MINGIIICLLAILIFFWSLILIHNMITLTLIPSEKCLLTFVIRHHKEGYILIILWCNHISILVLFLIHLLFQELQLLPKFTSIRRLSARTANIQISTHMITNSFLVLPFTISWRQTISWRVLLNYLQSKNIWDGTLPGFLIINWTCFKKRVKCLFSIHVFFNCVILHRQSFSNLFSIIETNSSFHRIIKNHSTIWNTSYCGFSICLCVICICSPCWRIFIVGLVAPQVPAWASSSGKQFKIRARAASLNQWDKFIGLSAVLTLHRAEQIHLWPTGLQCAEGVILPFCFYAEQQNLSYISKIKPHASAIRLPILPGLFPDQVCFVCKAPCLHHFQAFRQERIRDP